MVGTKIGPIDLWEHYLTSPLSDARFADVSLTFAVRAIDDDDFSDTAERLGWVIVDSRETVDETDSPWVEFTVRRRNTSEIPDVSIQ